MYASTNPNTVEPRIESVSPRKFLADTLAIAASATHPKMRRLLGILGDSITGGEFGDANLRREDQVEFLFRTAS